jgi:hypothetical protein
VTKVIDSKWTGWRWAWLLLAVFATAEAIATLLFWTYVVQPTASAPLLNAPALPLLVSIASLWSYVVFASLLYGLQRAANASGI